MFKIKDIVIFAVKFSYFFKRIECACQISFAYMKHPQITEIGTGKICGRTGKTGNLKIQCEWGPSTLTFLVYHLFARRFQDVVLAEPAGRADGGVRRGDP